MISRFIAGLRSRKPSAKMTRATTGRQSVLTRKVNQMVAVMATSRNEMKQTMEDATPDQEVTPPKDAERLAMIELLLEDFQQAIDNVDAERIVFDEFIDQITGEEAEKAQKTASDAIEEMDDAIAKAFVHVSELKAAARALKCKMRVAQAATSTTATPTTVTTSATRQNPRLAVMFPEQTLFLGDAFATDIARRSQSTVCSVKSVAELDAWNINDDRSTAVIVGISHAFASNNDLGLTSRAICRLIRRSKERASFYVVASPPLRSALSEYAHWLQLLEVVTVSEQQRFVCAVGRLSLITYFFHGREVSKQIDDEGRMSQAMRTTVIAFLSEIARLPMNLKPRPSK
ncbi:hypothetical protein L596_029456 [Steinernema carpocapsae]|uniref:Uncharacterized protein n=1 Tax=Steinernema carpocapsae TaxID=34508 RepID=A0A4U5LUQ3_STECR|nr:hypothetical protein L596_029456 [Steinernema carpocapsae]